MNRHTVGHPDLPGFVICEQCHVVVPEGCATQHKAWHANLFSKMLSGLREALAR